jgi:hypothetical protein
MIFGSRPVGRFDAWGAGTAIARAVPLQQSNNAIPAILLINIFSRSSEYPQRKLRI